MKKRKVLQFLVLMLAFAGMLAIIQIFYFDGITGFFVFTNDGGTEDFESGLSEWEIYHTGTGNDWTQSSSDPFAGSFHAESNPTDAGDFSYLQINISTSGLKNMNFSYYRKLVGLDASDDFVSEWWDGSSWVVVEQLGSGIENDGFYIRKSFILPSLANDNPGFAIRFGCSAGAVSEFCLLDDFSIIGENNTDITSPQITINSPIGGIFTGDPFPNLNVSVVEENIDSVWFSLDDGKNMTYAHRNGTIDFGFLDLVFVDDFGGYAEGSDGSPVWNVKPWFQTVEVENKTFKLHNETVIIDALASINNFSHLNYSASVMAMVPSGQRGGAYLTPRFGDVNNKYEIALDYDFSSININKVVNGAWQNIAARWTGELGVFVNKDEWHKIGLIADGNNITALVDDIEFLSILDSDLNNESFSGFSLIAFDDVGPHTAYFDDLEIHKGFEDGSYNLVVYANDSAGNVNFTSVSFIVDLKFPEVSINVPQNEIYPSSDFPLSINVSLSEEADQVKFSLDNGQSNTTMNSLDGKNFNHVLNSLADGSYNLVVYANDSAGNRNDTEKVSFSVLTPPVQGGPRAVLNSPTNNSVFNIGSVVLNSSVFDDEGNLLSAWIIGDGEILQSFLNQTNNSEIIFNWTGLSEGLHNWTVISNNGTDNATADLYFFEMNFAEIPLVNIDYPSFKSTYGFNESISLNFSVSGDDTGGCWYSLSLGVVNTSIPGCQNTSFNVPGDGNYSLTLFANETISGLVGSDNTGFFVNVDLPTIHLLSPEHPTYQNFSGVNFSYVPSFPGGIERCELWGDFPGNYSLNQTDLGIVSGQKESFFLNLTDAGAYGWAVLCSNSSGSNVSTGNRTLTIDYVPPNVTINEPSSGSDVRPGDLFLNFSLEDDLSPINEDSCDYNLTFEGSSSELKSIDGCEETKITLSLLGDYDLTLSAKDAAGNTGSSSSQFIVSESSGSGGGGSSGGGGTPAITGIANVSLLNIPAPSMRPGSSEIFSIDVFNSGQKFLNNCKLSLTGEMEGWFSTTSFSSLSSGQREEFTFSLNIPRDIVVRDYVSNLNIECDEHSALGEFKVDIIPSDFDFIIRNLERDVNSLIVSYSLRELLGEEQEISVEYTLINPADIVVVEDSVEPVSLAADAREEFEINVPLPKDSFGEFKVVIRAFNGRESVEVEREIILTNPGITGFAIFEGQRGRVFVLVIIALVILFLMSIRFMQRHHKRSSKRHSHHGRKFIRLRV